MRSRTVFDHIPRTAGTSIKAALASAIGERGDVAEPSCAHHALLGLAGGLRRFAASHLWFYPGEPLAPDWFYATLLRDPIERFLSLYSFFRAHHDQVRLGAVAHPDVVAAVRDDLDTYVADPARQRSFENVQARHFAWRVCNAPERLNEKALLDAAIASLEEYDLVGISSDAQAFVDAYCDSLSVPRQVLSRINVSPARVSAPDLSRATATRLWAANMVDTALCEWARQRFTERRPARPRAAAAPSPVVDFGTREIRILSSRCEGAESGGAVVAPGEGVVVRMACRAFVSEPDLTAGIAVRDEHNRLVYATNSRHLGMHLAVDGPRQLDLAFMVETPLSEGAYRVTLALHKGLSHEEGCYHWKDRATSFLVLRARASAPRWRFDVDDRVANVRVPRHQLVFDDV